MAQVRPLPRALRQPHRHHHIPAGQPGDRHGGPWIIDATMIPVIGSEVFGQQRDEVMDDTVDGRLAGVGPR